MAYSKQTFTDGQTLYAKHLNHIEEGLDTLDKNKLDASALPDAIDDALAQAKASGDFKGESGSPGADGEDGFSPTVAVTEITGGHKVTITDAAGAKSFNVMDGEDSTGGSGGGSGDPSVYVGANEPAGDSVQVWVETDSEESYNLPEIKDDAVSNVDTWSSAKINNAISYTTDETLTGGTWIDGKPIYRKVVNIPAIAKNTTNSSLSSPTAVISADIETLIDVKCVFLRDGANEIYTSPGWQSTTNADYKLYVHFGTTGEIIVRTGSALAIKSGHAIALYTKK